MNRLGKAWKKEAMKLPKNPLLGLILIMPVLYLPLISFIWPPRSKSDHYIFIAWLCWTGISLIVTIYLYSRSRKKG
jgi:hypothetical protein